MVFKETKWKDCELILEIYICALRQFKIFSTDLNQCLKVSDLLVRETMLGLDKEKKIRHGRLENIHL